MVIRTSYGTGGTVIGVEGPHVHVAPDGRDYRHFTIVYVPSERFGRHGKLDRNWINECVTVNGRVLKLLEANRDEVFVEGAVSCRRLRSGERPPIFLPTFSNQARCSEWSAEPFDVFRRVS